MGEVIGLPASYDVTYWIVMFVFVGVAMACLDEGEG